MAKIWHFSSNLDNIEKITKHIGTVFYVNTISKQFLDILLGNLHVQSQCVEITLTIANTTLKYYPIILHK